MVYNTRASEVNTLTFQLQQVHQKLQRSELKVQVIVQWIRDNFEESQFAGLWDLAREFDEETAAICSAASPCKSKSPLNESNSIFPNESTLSEPANIKEPPVAFVVVESVNSSSCSFTVHPQRGSNFLPVPIPSRTIQQPVIEPEERRKLEGRRPRKQSYKILEAQQNGDEIYIPGSEEIGDSNDIISLHSDPLGLSNPPSENGHNAEDMLYEPEWEYFDQRSEEEDLQSGSAEDMGDSASLYSCINCSETFTNSLDFVKHQLAHDVKGETQILDPAPPNEIIAKPSRLFKLKVVKPHRSSSAEPRIIKRRPNLPWPRKCEICGIELKNRGAQFHHKKKHEPGYIVRRRGVSGLPRPRVCDICGESLKDRNALYQHKRKAHGEGKVQEQKSKVKKVRKLSPRICEVCGKILKDGNSYHSHKKSHQEKEKEELICETCGKVLGSKITFAKHQELHLGIKPFLCSICQQSFARQTTLDNHMSIHSEERPLKCTYCPKSFKQRQGLMAHINRHLRRNQKICPICGQAHSTSNNLKRHILAVHERQRRYKCDKCDKAFKEGTHLKYHLKTHDNPKSKNRGLNKDVGEATRGSKRSLNPNVVRRSVPFVVDPSVSTEAWRAALKPQPMNEVLAPPASSTDSMAAP